MSETDTPELIADLPLGQSSRTTGRTISEGEFMLMHNLMGAMTPLHVNKHYMQTRPFGERILGGGMLICLLATGWAESDLYRRLVSHYGVRWTAALGVEAASWHPSTRATPCISCTPSRTSGSRRAVPARRS